MSRANDPAYPTDDQSSLKIDHHMGLTIREEFAKAAMAAIIASGRNGSSVVLDVASEAREYADAMLDELAREPRK